MKGWFVIPSSRRIIRVGLVLVLVGSGCSEELGPLPLNTTRITGVVLEGTQPVRGGFIEFVPVNGTVGNMHSGSIAADGTFAVEGVAVGSNAIGLVALKTTMPGRSLARFDTLSTPIRRKIPPGRSSELNLDLYEEILRLQKEREAVAR